MRVHAGMCVARVRAHACMCMLFVRVRARASALMRVRMQAFFGPHTFCFDLPHTIHVCFAASLLIWRENVSQAGEEAFRRCIFEYMSQSFLFGPHTDYCLF